MVAYASVIVYDFLQSSTEAGGPWWGLVVISAAAALLGAAVGAGALLWASKLQWDREHSVRWDDVKRDSYVAFFDATWRVQAIWLGVLTDDSISPETATEFTGAVTTQQHARSSMWLISHAEVLKHAENWHSSVMAWFDALDAGVADGTAPLQPARDQWSAMSKSEKERFTKSVTKNQWRFLEECRLELGAEALPETEHGVFGEMILPVD